MKNRRSTLITRGREDATLLSSILTSLGYNPLIDSLLKIDYEGSANICLNGVQALIMTSANGVRAFSRKSEIRDLDVFTVGDATALEAKKLGFSSIKSASGDIKSLRKLVLKVLSPIDGTLYHVTGTYMAGQLGKDLISHGFEYYRDILYNTVEAKQFLNETMRAFSIGNINSVLFYSPRTAATFRKLIIHEGIMERLQVVYAFCLSKAVESEIKMLPWRQLIVADQPTQDALLTRLKQKL